MTTPCTTPCTRLWEAEAFEDGRLGEADRLSFERHTAACEECSQAIASLITLRETMQAAAFASSPKTTPLEHQRLRRNIMRSANEVLLTPYADDRAHGPRRGLPRGVMRFAFGALALGVTAVIVLVMRGRGPADGGMVATTDRIHPSSSLDDKTPATAESDEPSITTPPNEVASATHSASTTHSPAKSALRAWPSLQAELFDDGVASFKARNYERADEQLERFVDGFPNDPRCEDADYLRAVAHLRSSDKSGAKELARAYLLKYPNGLRRIDAERILDSAD